MAVALRAHPPLPDRRRAAAPRRRRVGAGPLEDGDLARLDRRRGRSVAYADEAGEPAADDRARPRHGTGSLHRAGEQPLDEVALEREEHGERHDQRDERRGRDQVDVRAELAQVGEDRDRDRLHVLAERQRDDQVVPRPEELEDRERGDRRQAERQDQPQEDPRSPRRRRSAPTRGCPSGSRRRSCAAGRSRTAARTRRGRGRSRARCRTGSGGCRARTSGSAPSAAARRAARSRR